MKLKQWRKRTRILVMLLLIAGGVLLAFLLFRVEAGSPTMAKQEKVVSLKNHDFLVRLATTPDTQARGLSGTAGLQPNRGMLFIFPIPDKACFWMKDMRYNLDILWFDREQHLVYQQRDLSPDTYPTSYCPPTEAKYVLEASAGTAQKLGLQTGDKIQIHE